MISVGRNLDALAERWIEAWPGALEVWSRFTRLRAPLLCRSHEQAEKEGLTGSFAMIRLVDQAIVVNLAAIAEQDLDDFAPEILAHEIGHHVLAPATLTDHGRMLARMRVSLPTLEQHAPMIANMYTDLLINDRLQRSAKLRMSGVFEVLAREAQGGMVWRLYLRIYEVLWSLPRGQLGAARLDDEGEGDAWLGARLLRSYASEWLAGSGRFAALFLPYLLRDTESAKLIERLLDTRHAGRGGEPAGLVDRDPDERAGALHPAQDPELSGVDSDEPAPPPPREDAPRARQFGQARQPFEYGELLRALGMELSDHDVAVRYYREKALAYLIPFPSRQAQESQEPLMEGLETWDFGHPIEALDGLQSVLVSPRVIPGMTTRQRSWGTDQGREPEREPLDLDLYVDSSGSMVNPQIQLSFPALAGAVLCLSALRAGARVQATLWSGKAECSGTPGFVRDEQALLRVLSGHFGGGTQFPIHRLRSTYDARSATARPAHVLVISDDGVSTMFDHDERGESGWSVARRALDRARGGGTFVLELPENWEKPQKGYLRAALETIGRARAEQGWSVHRVASLEDLIAFARAFSALRYGKS